VKLTTHLHLVPRSKNELHLHSPSTPSWHGAWVESTGITLPLPPHLGPTQPAIIRVPGGLLPEG